MVPQASYQSLMVAKKRASTISHIRSTNFWWEINLKQSQMSWLPLQAVHQVQMFQWKECAEGIRMQWRGCTSQALPHACACAGLSTPPGQPGSPSIGCCHLRPALKVSLWALPGNNRHHGAHLLEPLPAVLLGLVPSHSTAYLIGLFMSIHLTVGHWTPASMYREPCKGHKDTKISKTQCLTLSTSQSGGTPSHNHVVLWQYRVYGHRGILNENYLTPYQSHRLKFWDTVQNYQNL